MNNALKPKTSINKYIISNLSNSKIEKYSFSPKTFKRVLGFHNRQFKDFKANDTKELLLYLLQTMHEELNYFGIILQFICLSQAYATENQLLCILCAFIIIKIFQLFQKIFMEHMK